MTHWSVLIGCFAAADAAAVQRTVGAAAVAVASLLRLIAGARLGRFGSGDARSLASGLHHVDQAVGDLRVARAGRLLFQLVQFGENATDFHLKSIQSASVR